MEDQPASACSTDEIKDVGWFGGFFELFYPFDTLHKLLDNDQFRQSSNTTSIFVYVSDPLVPPKDSSWRYLPRESKQRPRSMLFVSIVSGADIINAKPSLQDWKKKSDRPLTYVHENCICHKICVF